MIPSIFSVFKKAVGPSSSHTTGALFCGADLAARLGTLYPDGNVSRIDIILAGSFAYTGEGHLTDKAAACGLSGYDIMTETMGVNEKYSEFLKKGRLSVSGLDIPFSEENIVFDRAASSLRHPNTLRFEVTDGAGGRRLFEYISVGGGVIEGPYENGILLRKAGPETGMPARPENDLSGHLCMDDVLAYCGANKMTFTEYAYKNEELNHGHDRAETMRRLLDIWSAMKANIKSGVTGTGELPGPLNLKRRAAQMHASYLSSAGKWRVLSEEITLAEIYAISVAEDNACGAKVVTAPTCGSAGVLPAVLRVLKDKYHRDPESVCDALAVAGLFGATAMKNASISGAYVGCQGEIGVAASMAAAAAAVMLEFDNEIVESAAEIALEHHLGLTCDPVGGLVQIPCIERNAAGAVSALNAANIAFLTDGQHNVSYDEALAAMQRTGMDMNEKYKETSLGGLAVVFPNCPVVSKKSPL